MIYTLFNNWGVEVVKIMARRAHTMTQMLGLEVGVRRQSISWRLKIHVKKSNEITCLCTSRNHVNGLVILPRILIGRDQLLVPIVLISVFGMRSQI